MAVDPETGEVEILDYVIVEDGGVLVNPMIVDGQMYGGTAQGIGTALYEEMPYDAQGQPLASTLSDYMLPGPTRSAGDPHPAYGNAVALHAFRPEGHRRRRRHRAARGDHQCHQRRGEGPGGRAARIADHATAYRRGDRTGTPASGRSMKPAPFEYVRPQTVGEAVRLLAATPDAKILAGGQTLGPMLNLRLAQPPVLVDIGRIPELAAVTEDRDAITIGATVTHAAIEDGRISDPTGGFLAQVARGIAYRAVRTRGTIGGSLAHADPAADWLSALTALGAEVAIAGERSSRRVPLAAFVRGAMDTELAPDELLVGIRVPRFSRQARFGFHKICRKTGEFAEAIGVVVEDPERSFRSLVAGATGGRPLAIGMTAEAGPKGLTIAQARRLLELNGFSGDRYELQLHAVALKNACAKAYAA